MTAARPPASNHATSDRLVGFFAWATQAATASVYLMAMIQHDVWRPMFDTDPVGAACALSVVASMAYLWAVGLWLEQKSVHDRYRQRLYRKAGLFGHLGLLLPSVAAAYEDPYAVGLWIAMGLFSCLAVFVWFGWIHSLRLPPEDQAVIDTIYAREAERAAAAREASEKAQRRRRLDAIAGGLGYRLVDRPTSQPEENASPVRWEIPRGKHAPLVYFIRNGNRLKIGTTTELRRRIRTLALRPTNVALLIHGGRQLERDFHRKFAGLRIGNSEWFAYDGALADYVNTETDRMTREDQEK